MDQIAFASIVTHLSVALGLSLSIERTLEVIKHFLEPFLRKGIVSLMADPKDSEKAVKTAEKNVQELKTAIEDIDKKPDKAPIENNGGDGEWEESSTLSMVHVTKATDPDGGKTLKAFLMQIFGLIAGIIFARIFDLQLFKIFLTPFTENLSAGHDYLLTGLVIGGSSSHVHVLIRLLTLRKDRLLSSNSTPETPDITGEKTPQKESPLPPIEIDKADWLDIPYDGGVDRELLQNVHRRGQDPNLIVYHHTAMHSDSTFEDVVRVIKKRNWSTGYHCVITQEGSIHPFCRWDRYGNHAKGKNLKSLGISFNGNFETSTTPGNNADGRYGNKVPTEAQLKAGARVVALWAHLYKDISLDFTKSIVPHKNLKSTVCPGSNFPYAEFEGWVRYFYEQWKQSEIVTAKIETFKHKDYLYVDKSRHIRKA